MRRRLLVGLAVALLGGSVLPHGGSVASAGVSDEVVFHRIVTPVDGTIRYSNDWQDPRSGHLHEGNDLLGSKLMPLLAAADGTVTWTRTDGNNMLSIKDAEGWTYTYVHINNDTPGTDDGANPPEHRFFPGIAKGVKVKAGQPIAYMGDSGNAESTSPHLHFEMARPDGVSVNPYWSLLLSQGRRAFDRCSFDDTPARKPDLSAAPGYWALTADGGVRSYGAAPFHGSTAGMRLAAPVLSLTPTTSGGGSWQLAGDGGVFSFGDAAFHGSTGAMRLNQPVVGMAPTASGQGYWLVAADGGVFSFGDATFLGSTGGMRLNQPIIGMARTASGQGYWLVAADGGVFSFGDATFLGSLGDIGVPVVHLTPTPSGKGYWLLTAAGSVATFGDATWKGGVDTIGFCERPKPVGMAATRTGKGYWIATADGNTFNFGDAVDHGSAHRDAGGPVPSVAVAASR
ncbi:MAG: M23 family metallopeptidase [Acidimicrobiia bacterium]